MVNEPSVTITVRVVPRASRSEIVGLVAGEVKIRIAAPPVEGAANAELIKVLAKELGVPKSTVEIVSGQGSRTKRVRLSGVSNDKIQHVLSRKS